jgi:ABC-type sugar transport system substrate-binding protein
MSDKEISIGSINVDRRRFLMGLGGVGAAAAMGSFLTGCSSDNAGKKLVIGSIVPTLDAQFWQRYKAFSETVATELGIELITINANNSADALNKGIEDLIARGVDGLIFVPYFGAGPKGIAAADAAGIPVMCVDTLPDDVIVPGGEFENYIGVVGPDDETAGYEMADALSKTLVAGADGKKKIIAIEGTPGTSVAINRFKGLQRYISEGGDLTLLGNAVGNFVASDSQKATEDLMQAHPDFQGVWTANGGTATGALAALKNAGKTPGVDVKVVTMDLNPDNVLLVGSGELEFDTGGHWLQGGFASIIMFDWLNGIQPSIEERTRVIKLLPVTEATLPQLEIDYPEGQPPYVAKEHSRFLTPDGPDAVIELAYSTPVELGLKP